MIREKLIFKVPVEIVSNIKTFAQIFGANYYEDWNANDASSLSLTGSLVNSCTSIGLNGGVLAGSGSTRPSLVADASLGKNVFDFDGVSEFLQVASSVSDYNFLHSSAGGCVILISEITDSNPNNAQAIINNNGLGSSAVGFYVAFDDRSAFSRNNALISAASKGDPGLVPSSVLINNSFVTQSFVSSVSVLDSNNAVAADRNVVTLNGGAEVKNNTSTVSATGVNSSYDLTVGKSSAASSFFGKIKVTRIIIADVIPSATQLSEIQTTLNSEYGTFPIS